MKNTVGRNLAITTLALSAVFSAAQGINVQVNGNPVNFYNTKPQYINGRVLVPLRGVFENMGATVQWNPVSKTVTAMRADTDIALRIGERWANVDGKTVAMDVPAMLINGSTMVPIRFVSESLGANVAWNDPSRTVLITTNYAVTDPAFNNNGKPIEFANARKFNLQKGTVIPVTLQTRVSSKESRVGDLVRGTIDNFNLGSVSYEQGDFDFPDGTTIEGRVSTAVPKSGNNPGMVEMDFGRIVMPDGRTMNIDGSLIALDNKNVARNENGVLVASSSSKDNKMVYAGYGAGAGLIVGLLTKRPIESTLLGGILGYLAGTLEQQQRRPNDLTLQPGTKFGVRLDQSTAVTLPARTQ